MIVLDTNAISELMKPRPDPTFVDWWELLDSRAVHVSSISIAEILFGIEKLTAGRRQRQLRAFAAEVFDEFNSLILDFDKASAGEYAQLVVERIRIGRPISGFDAQIAAICRVHGASLATRNSKDFEGTGIDLINPWSEQR